jgi:hypothetical protein
MTDHHPSLGLRNQVTEYAHVIKPGKSITFCYTPTHNGKPMQNMEN